MIEGHGSDQYKYGANIQADFSSNVWHEGVPVGLVKYLKTCLKDIVRYPEPDGRSLREKLGFLHGVTTEQVILGNGSVELFYILAQAFRSGKSTIVYPAFAEYEDACKLHQHQVNFVRLDELRRSEVMWSDLVWLGNPNNPDGAVVEPEEIVELCERHAETIFVVDEAYASLCLGFRSAVPMLARCRNLLITRSLTKVFAMPGIRLGYALGSLELIARLRQFQIPWSVNTLALEAGGYLVANYSSLLPNLQRMRYRSERFQEQLGALEGLTVYPSAANYFLVRLHQGNAHDLKAFLVEKYGLLIRDAANFRGLNEAYFRVALQEEKYNDLLVEGVKLYLVRTRKPALA